MVAPKIIKKLPKVVRSKVGETTTLEAQAFGKPKPVTKWRKSNEEIIPSEEYQIDNYPDGTSILTINNLQPETVDQITFEAVSPLGVAETVTELHVEGILGKLMEIIVIYLKFEKKKKNQKNFEKYFLFSAVVKSFFKILIFYPFIHLIQHFFPPLKTIHVQNLQAKKKYTKKIIFF